MEETSNCIKESYVLCLGCGFSTCASPNSVTAGELGEVTGRPEEDNIEELRETGKRETGLQPNKLRFIADRLKDISTEYEKCGMRN